MKNLSFMLPIKGSIINLSDVEDPGFSSGSMGPGIAIKPLEGKVYAPFDATISVLFATKHAIGLTGKNNDAELLIHIGIDTVNTKGEGFKTYVKQGDNIKKGDLLLEFDIDLLKKNGYDVTTPVIITNADKFSHISVKDEENSVIIKDDINTIIPSPPNNIVSSAKHAELSADERVAGEILANIGGKENIRSVEHCATRLRLILKDKTKINEKAIENIDGIKGQFFAAAQYQIILGTGFVNKVYAVIIRGSDSLSQSNNKDTAYADMTLLQKASRILGDIFVPIIPVLVATGLFMGLRGTLISLGVKFSPHFMLMSQILTDTAFAFLPALVTWSAMKKFGGTPVIGIVLGLMLVAPQLPNSYLVANGSSQPLMLNIFGASIPVIGYQGSVLPALILGIFASKLQLGLKKIIPDVLDLILTPFLTLFISMILGILIIGPVMHHIELFIFNAVRMFLELPYGIGGFVVGGLQQVIVVSGVHQIFNALEIELLSSTGKDMFNAIITGAVIAQGGAALAVAIRTKNPKKRSLYISSVIPAFLGITEPAIFGINLRFIKPFICGLAGGALSGMAASWMHLAGTGMGITVIPGTLLYMHQLPQYLLVNAIGLIVGFGLTIIFFKPEE
ncbi:glucose PTS transporter subunit IIA [Pectinatus sottacetonis]|uniref:glucose PTS transporter subunit IIA n=1 Tax=Pectinatus sottacetonis TaxID=1002795 RepID=UPI0018C7C665|nr:glucose PTS transporter subunit IIA [Pectinatus sottacetonis]